MKPARRIAALAILTAKSLLAWAQGSLVKRSDFYVPSDPGTDVFVREVRAEPAPGAQAPVLLIHGARVPGIASFDLPVLGGSLAMDLALAGFRVYILDVRGYGKSTRSRGFDLPSNANPPLVRSPEAVRDIGAVVRDIRRRNHQRKVALLGWAAGGSWAGYYASLHSDQLSHLIMLNTLFGADAPQPLIGRGSDLEDPHQPGQFNFAQNGAYRCNSSNSLLTGWHTSIPLANKDDWRDPAVANAYVDAALASDAASSLHHPPCFRSPNGALEDSFYEATGRQLWDGSLITVPTLVIACERDFWSRPEDREKLKRELVHAPVARVVVIPNATHFVFLDRPERGRKQFLDEVTAFLSR
jgi:pimeloyl-ACP methyl ester carboxylesterase